MDPQKIARASYDELGFLILTDLPKGSEFGLDGQFWTVNDFNGVKLIPPGLHLFVLSASSSSSNRDDSTTTTNGSDIGSSSSSSGLGVRHGLLKFYQRGQSGRRRGKRNEVSGEILVEKWDPLNESLSYETVSSSTAKTASAGKRRRIKRLPTEEDTLPELIISREYLQNLDHSLAPYPSPDSDHTQRWKSLSGYITEKTLARVVGIDGKGVARVDALLEGWKERAELIDAKEKQSAQNRESGEGDVQGKTFWGKERPAERDGAQVEEVIDSDQDDNDRDEEGLEFIKFDDKRTWPKGAVGTELSRWSKDKSWLLSHVVETQLETDAKELLAELQLSFILFTLVYNFSALSSYKSIFSLICRSDLLCHPSSSRPLDIDSGLPNRLLSTETTLPLFASFLSVLHSQISFLEPTFFSTQLPSLEEHLLASLSQLRASLSDASREWYSLATDSPASKIWETLVNRWNALAAESMEKFGWELGLIRGSKAKYGELEKEYQQGGVPFEELEEGEDAPVIVDLEGLDSDDDRPILVGF